MSSHPGYFRPLVSCPASVYSVFNSKYILCTFCPCHPCHMTRTASAFTDKGSHSNNSGNGPCARWQRCSDVICPFPKMSPCVLILQHFLHEGCTFLLLDADVNTAQGVRHMHAPGNVGDLGHVGAPPPPTFIHLWTSSTSHPATHNQTLQIFPYKPDRVN